jgi:hypothetical protein
VVRKASSFGLVAQSQLCCTPLYTIDGRERNSESLSCFVLRLCIAVTHKPALYCYEYPAALQGTRFSFVPAESCREKIRRMC